MWTRGGQNGVREGQRECVWLWLARKVEVLCLYFDYVNLSKLFVIVNKGIVILLLSKDVFVCVKDGERKCMLIH